MFKKKPGFAGLFVKESTQVMESQTITIHKPEREAQHGEHFATIKRGSAPEIKLHKSSHHPVGISHMKDDSDEEIKRHLQAHVHAMEGGKLRSFKRDGDRIEYEADHFGSDIHIKKHADGSHTMEQDAAHETYDMAVGKHKYSDGR